MGFYININHRFRKETTRMLKSWANINSKLASLRNRRIFLLNCKKFAVYPNHIVNNIRCMFGSIFDSSSAIHVKKHSEQLTSKILRIEFRITVKKKLTLTREGSNIWQALEQTLPNGLLHEFRRRQDISYNCLLYKIKKSNLDKINKLKDQQQLRLVTQSK